MSMALSWNAPDLMSFEAAGRSHPGLCRRGNEDAFAIHAGAGLLMVADGLGGHLAGEVASWMAVDTACDEIINPAVPPASVAAALVAAIERANLAVFTAGQRSPDLTGMGTTMVASLAFPGGVVVAHVGDSRAYLLRERWLARLTRDHSVCNLPLFRGFEQFFGDSVQPHALTRAVGSSREIDVETRTLRVRCGDVLLLCSDGLTNAIDDQEIAAILTAHRDPDAAAAALIASANEHGGPDNVTVALQRWS